MSRSEKRPPSDQRQVIDKIVGLLEQYSREEWFGDLTITLKAGTVQLIKATEVIKPEELVGR